MTYLIYIGSAIQDSEEWVLRRALQKLFTDNLTPRQKQYEALRQLAFGEGSYEDIAKQFGYSPNTLRTLESLALRGELDFFPAVKRGPKQSRVAAELIRRIVELRKTGNYSIYDISRILSEEDEVCISYRTVQRILNQAGIGKLSRRATKERGVTHQRALISDRAKNLNVREIKPLKIDCPVAGVFFFMPYIIESGVMDIVERCELPESNDIGGKQAALSMLLLKLIGNERLSHIKAYDQEPSFGIFAGLNLLPKSTFMTTYSCRTSEGMLENLQHQVITHFKQQYGAFYETAYINLDFHAIPHFGEESQMEKIWCGARGKALKGANTLLAQAGSSDIILYTKADILRRNESQEIKHFVDYWKRINGAVAETLVFDCKLTTYQVLGELDSQTPNIKFITLRKRNKKLLEDTMSIPAHRWLKVHLPIPKRKHQNFLAFEESVKLTGCARAFRQIIVKDHGRVQPTYIVTNNKELKLIDILEVYAKRWHIENKISELVSFFNLNALSSPLMVRIHFDIFWTVIADTLYRRMAIDLPRFEHSQAKTIFKKFINFPGRLEFDGNEFVIKIRQRSHTPILLGVAKLAEPFEIPWLDNLPMKIIWTA